MDILPTLKEAVESASELATRINRHPAIIQSNVTKKEEAMEWDCGDLTEQIDLANRLVAQIDDQIKIIFKTVKNSYSKRLPELTVADPMQYILTAQLLANQPDRIKDPEIKDQLLEVLDSKMQLLVTMTAATTQGVKLEQSEMDNILKACSAAVHLNELKSKLILFVERNMATIAPNLSVIVGAPIAAKLMGHAGGLTELAFMPSCNVPALGANKTSKLESDVTIPRRVGIIYECDLIQQIPFDHTKDVRKLAVKKVANKCALAARCDANGDYSDGREGRKFRDEIESFINKALEPPPKKAFRPLPAPIEKSGKRRGGKRVRKMKERYGQTELRKAANRMNFGDVGDDAYQNDLGLGASQLKAIQKLRGPQINEKTKVRLSKEAQKKLAKAQKDSEKFKSQPQEATTSIVFTPQQQGLEIFNPKAKESFTLGSSDEANSYFSDTAGFFKIKKDDAKT